MPHVLKNKHLELYTDLPLEGYNLSRFDWSGKITKVKYQGIELATVERKDREDLHHFGRGFYNEFGIDTALGFEEANVGEWFHKIGVGLLRKDDSEYNFYKPYEIRPATFEWNAETNYMQVTCTSEEMNGYSYVLKKQIKLLAAGFSIEYHLRNTGTKDIHTDEYVHNFMAVNDDPIGASYVLRFPFTLKPELFLETVNPEGLVQIDQDQITIVAKPNRDFFFSNISGGKKVLAAWTLAHLKHNVSISEKTSFKTDKVNLWGWGHVISPELFYKMALRAGETANWSRHYEIDRH